MKNIVETNQQLFHLRSSETTNVLEVQVSFCFKNIDMKIIKKNLAIMSNTQGRNFRLLSQKISVKGHNCS